MLGEYQAGLERAGRWSMKVSILLPPKRPHPKIEFFNFATGRITQIASVAKRSKKVSVFLRMDDG